MVNHGPADNIFVISCLPPCAHPPRQIRCRLQLWFDVLREYAAKILTCLDEPAKLRLPFALIIEISVMSQLNSARLLTGQLHPFETLTEFVFDRVFLCIQAVVEYLIIGNLEFDAEQMFARINRERNLCIATTNTLVQPMLRTALLESQFTVYFLCILFEAVPEF